MNFGRKLLKLILLSIKQMSNGNLFDIFFQGNQKNVAKISLVGVPDQPGVAAKVFSSIGKHDINIALIVQAEHRCGKSDLSFLVSTDAFHRVNPFLEELVKLVKGERVVVDENVATVSLVGEGVQREPCIAARMFTSLAAAGINIDLISTSNLMLTCVIPKDRAEEGVRALHREFFEEGKAEGKADGKTT